MFRGITGVGATFLKAAERVSSPAACLGSRRCGETIAPSLHSGVDVVTLILTPSFFGKIVIGKMVVFPQFHVLLGQTSLRYTSGRSKW